MATGSRDRQSSPEYSTLRRSFRNLIIHVKAQAGDICDALFEYGFIPPDVKGYVRTDSIPDETKARKLIDTLLDKVRENPSVYYGFIDILKSEGPSADTVVEQLENCFEKEKVCFDCSSSEGSHHSSGDDRVFMLYSALVQYYIGQGRRNRGGGQGCSSPPNFKVVGLSPPIFQLRMDVLRRVHISWYLAQINVR